MEAGFLLIFCVWKNRLILSFENQKIKHNINHFTLFFCPSGFLFQENKNVCFFFFDTCPIGPALNVNVPFFFFCWRTSFGVTAHHPQHARTTKGSSQGRIITVVPEKEWKVKKIKHELSGRVQFQSNSILNTAHHSSIACVGFPDFSGILRGWRISDSNGRGLEERGEEQSGRFLTATPDVDGEWVPQVIHTGKRSPSCRLRGWLENQFDPFLVGSLLSWVARGAALMLNTGNGWQGGGKTEGCLEKKIS